MPSLNFILIKTAGIYLENFEPSIRDIKNENSFIEAMSHQNIKCWILLVLLVKTLRSLFEHNLSMAYLVPAINLEDVIFYLQVPQDAKIYHLCIKFSSKRLS